MADCGCQVVPPAAFSLRRGGDDVQLLIKSPIQQCVEGTGGAGCMHSIYDSCTAGVYQFVNVVKRALTVDEFRTLSQSSDHATPSYADDHERMEKQFWSAGFMHV